MLYAEALQVVVPSRDCVRVFDKPGSTAGGGEVVCDVPNGGEVLVWSEADGYSKIQFGRHCGFVDSRNLRPSKHPYAFSREYIPVKSVAKQTVCPERDFVRVFDRPGSKAGGGNVVCDIPNGHEVVIWREVNGYCEVQFSDQLGFADSRNFSGRVYNLLLNARVLGPAVELHARVTEKLAAEFGVSLVWDALKEGHTYAHITLVYDFQADATQLEKLMALVSDFASSNMALPLRFSGACRFGNDCVCLNVDSEHPGFAQAHTVRSELLKKLCEALPCIPIHTPHWHATVAMGFDELNQASQCDAIFNRVSELVAEPVDFSFDNITVMAKAGPFGPYKGTALPVMTFWLASGSESSRAVAVKSE